METARVTVADLLSVCRSQVPFELEVMFSETDLAGTNNRGFCLNYYQMLC